MKALKMPMLWLLLAVSAVPLAACEEGVFEDAGEEVDDAVDEGSNPVATHHLPTLDPGRARESRCAAQGGQREDAIGVGSGGA